MRGTAIRIASGIRNSSHVYTNRVLPAATRNPDTCDPQQFSRASGRKPLSEDRLILGIHFGIDPHRDANKMLLPMAERIAALSSQTRINKSGVNNLSQVTLFNNLPARYKDIYVESLRRHTKPIPSEMWTPFPYPSGDSIGLESQPSTEFDEFIWDVLYDFEEFVDKDTMRSLRDIDWTRQIRIPFLSYQKPEEVEMLMNEIYATYPEGIDLGPFRQTVLRHGPAPHDVQEEWRLEQGWQDHTIFKQDS